MVFFTQLRIDRNVVCIIYVWFSCACKAQGLGSKLRDYLGGDADTPTTPCGTFPVISCASNTSVACVDLFLQGKAQVINHMKGI